jgi:integrase
MAKGCAQGDGPIFRRIDGRWYAAVDLSQQNGKRKRKYLYGATRPEVREQLIKVQQDQQRGLPVPAERQTVAEFMDRWLEDSVRLSVAPLTYEQYAQHARLYLAPALGHIRLSQLNPQHVQAFIKARLSDGLSARTVKLSLLILRMALKQAVRWDTISRNVPALVDPPRVQRPEVKPLSDVEARTFLEAVRGKRLEAAYLLLLSLGLRRGETLGLRWQDIDLEKRTACIRQTLQRVGGRSLDGQPSRLMFKAPKSARSRRTLPLSESLVKALTAHRARQLEEGLAAGPRWQDTGLIR